MTQAVNNLISNALKFVAPGATPRVRIRSEDRGSTVRFWVEDRGIGISAQNRDNKLFRVFERLGGDQYPGTGIGLAIVKRAADRMGGNVGVESEAGKGSRFWIELRSPGSPLL
jgi:signal transduction histidine kinase